MASIASSSNSTTPHDNSRIEAGPLPSKRGEIGFVEDPDEQRDEGRSASPEIAIPARHPADRDTPATTTGPEFPDTGSTLIATNTLSSPSSTTLASSNNSISKKQRVLGFFKPKKVPVFGGFLLSTLLAFLCQILLLGGTIAAWIISVKRVSTHNISGFGPSSIFLHVVFGVAVCGQLLFLERRVFRLRAERYSYVHPGEILPSSRHLGAPSPSIAFSPWNRPPLPTYAAALAQSGVGTGDVEDHLIAAPPPPAYGNTRGSTMLLAGYLRDSLRVQRPISVHTQMSQTDERPISYISRDEQWEEIQDAERARRLEETLARLERPVPRS
ncbi:hypothetical protein Hypma_016323 [Hypsizygus marmoreus]|uniref:Uncharacterized protein n=1 Tax=Hypsizygus marmoreus TaxID=39966 RepID=A0A369J4H6_HYPMA|nr:hypothetical protein Hypma_016323 [Hypsizygus marmoreus]